MAGCDMAGADLTGTILRGIAGREKLRGLDAALNVERAISN